MTSGGLAILLYRAASVILPSLWSFSTVKHASFLFAYFLVQMKNT